MTLYVKLVPFCQKKLLYKKLKKSTFYAKIGKKFAMIPVYQLQKN